MVTTFSQQISHFLKDDHRISQQILLLKDIHKFPSKYRTILNDGLCISQQKNTSLFLKIGTTFHRKYITFPKDGHYNSHQICHSPQRWS